MKKKLINETPFELDECSKKILQYNLISDSVSFLKQILDDKKDKQLDLVTYLSQNTNSYDEKTKSFFKKLTNDLREKGIINDNEHRVILRHPRLINKSEINKALSSINKEMEEAANEFEELFQENENDDYYL